MKASVCVFIYSTCAMHLLTTLKGLVRDKLKPSAIQTSNYIGATKPPLLNYGGRHCRTNN